MAPRSHKKSDLAWRQRTSVSALASAAPDRWVAIGLALVLAAITLIVFGQTLNHAFINYDDPDYVTKNAQVARGITLEGVVWAFTHVHASNWHPLTWISHMADSHLYGMNPRGHHLTNVVLHAVNAILLFLLVRQMTASLWRSFFVAALFAVHPLRIESVAWVAERKDVLSGLFFMLTLMAYTRYTRAPDRGRYALVAALFALGLMCKPMLVSVPLVLLLLDYWPLSRLPSLSLIGAEERKNFRRLVLEKLPLLALGLASCAVTLFAQREAIKPVTQIALPARLANAAVAYVDYMRQMFWPKDLAVLYPWEAARLQTLHVASAVLLLAGISITVFLLRSRRYLVTGWLWYLIMLVPVIGILQVGNQGRADRYTYLPQIGLYLLITWSAVELCARLKFYRVLLSGIAATGLVALILAARTQASYWQDSETLWRHALNVTTDNVIAEGNLGEAIYRKGRNAEARFHFEKSLRINRRQPELLSALGVFDLEVGRIDEARAHLQEAIAIEPNHKDAHFNLGNVYLHTGDGAEALTHYERALAINPDDVEALNNMAWILATWPNALTRNGVKAVVLAERADALTRGQNQLISATLAAAYAEAGRFPEAAQAAERALQLAIAEGNESRANSIRAQIELYKSGQAFRDRRYMPISCTDATRTDPTT